ncbi:MULTISPECIES: hypothetical protein [unclassified Haladaptatus]|uniref:hypothetical protein n=1 Tax=unclassified Haladaptatus TaxID=2622732 RepID=UPI0023E802A8|nr:MULTISPECIES: hypothetical protein [unclassified Haladaptatus]
MNRRTLLGTAAGIPAIAGCLSLVDSSDVKAHKRLEVTNRTKNTATITITISEANSAQDGAVFEAENTLDPGQVEVFDTDLLIDETYAISASTTGGLDGSEELTMCDCILVMTIYEGNIDIGFAAY